MPKLTIVAHLTAKSDKIDLVKAELEKLIDITRSEEGCLQYDLHQDNENPAHFMFNENWESRELWQAHMSARHLQDYIAATEGAVEVFTVHEMTHLAYAADSYRAVPAQTSTNIRRDETMKCCQP